MTTITEPLSFEEAARIVFDRATLLNELALLKASWPYDLPTLQRMEYVEQAIDLANELLSAHPLATRGN